MAKELSEEKILGSKFTLSLQTMIAAGTGLASLIGMWYALQADIQEAKELPVPVSLFSQEYPSKGISDYNWSPSYEQYKQQVGDLGENQDEIFEMVEELQGLKIGCPEEIAWRMNFISRNDLEKIIYNYKNVDYAKYLKSILNDE